MMVSTVNPCEASWSIAEKQTRDVELLRNRLKWLGKLREDGKITRKKAKSHALYFLLHFIGDVEVTKSYEQAVGPPKESSNGES